MLHLYVKTTSKDTCSVCVESGAEVQSADKIPVKTFCFLFNGKIVFDVMSISVAICLIEYITNFKEQSQETHYHKMTPTTIEQ